MTDFFFEILLLVSCKQGNPYSKVGKIKKLSNKFEFSPSVFLLDFLVSKIKRVGISKCWYLPYFYIPIYNKHNYHGKVSCILDRTFHFNRTTNVCHNFRLSNKRNRWSSILSKRPFDQKGHYKQVWLQYLHPFFDFSHNFQVKICMKRSGRFVCI